MSYKTKVGWYWVILYHDIFWSEYCDITIYWDIVDLVSETTTEVKQVRKWNKYGKQHTWFFDYIAGSLFFYCTDKLLHKTCKSIVHTWVNIPFINVVFLKRNIFNISILLISAIPYWRLKIIIVISTIYQYIAQLYTRLTNH